MTQTMHQVLVIEDDAAIRDVLRVLLQAEHYRVVEAETAARGEIEARSHRPDLLLVDLGSARRRRRQADPAHPRMVAGTGRRAVRTNAWKEQKIAALDAGATTTSRSRSAHPELLARVRAALRRNARGTEQPAGFEVGNITIDLARREARAPDREVHLTPLEYRVLESLARQSGMIVTASQLIREVWGPGRQGDTRSLRVCLRNLRQKLEPDPSRPRHIVTEAGLGYRLRVNDE